MNKDHRLIFQIISFLSVLFFCFQTTNVIAQSLFTPDMKNKAEEKEMSCLACHRQINIHTNEGVIANQLFCKECHSQEECQKKINGQGVSLKVPADMFEHNQHQYVACIECHTAVAQSPHSSEKEIQCLDCHSFHGQDITRAPHLRVQCQACHFQSEPVALDKEKDQIILAHINKDNKPISLSSHEMAETKDLETCRKCHYSKNQVGAPAAVLPGKSLLCLACHNSPVSISNAGGFAGTLYWGPLIIFLLGIISTLYVWFKGSVGHGEQSFHNKIIHYSRAFWFAISTKNIFKYMKTFILDIFFQRKILAEGVQRWSIHSLIYWAFFFRFILSLLGLIIYNIWPDSSLALVLINKNNPFMAFTFDLLGLFIIFGIIWACIQRFIIRPVHFSQEQDSPALIIIGLLVLTGFILEGARIALTGIPAEKSGYAFIGYLIAQAFEHNSTTLPNTYGYIWYAHALLWAAFIIYLPFGKLKHIIMTPLNLLLNTEVNMKERGP
ncbi:MAG TPA: hypothetical protein VKN82_01390 [Desulfohalobiaceae bacterium]|nr:hypothetical protein [Desulfohalobiaceae bacterium]